LTDENDNTLIFESRFESGNLLAAIKVTDNEYDLILQNDINTNGHTQWYFFRVGNTKVGQKIKFNILNLAKNDSLYNYGMKILCFSN
jgi:cytosolic carboxypeptidase protein 2/3